MAKPIKEAQASGIFLKIPYLVTMSLQTGIVIYVCTLWFPGTMGVAFGSLVAVLLLAFSWVEVGRTFFRPRYLRAYEDHVEGCAGGLPFTLAYGSISRLAFEGGSLFFHLANGDRIPAPTGAFFDAPYRVVCEHVLDNPGPTPFFDLEN